MPGLVGIFGNGGDRLLLNEMCESIYHKKWYRVDKYANGDFYAGRVHLGILNPQKQPIFNEDKRFLIFMDGELYGYGAERDALEKKGYKFKIDNDAEFCLHLFEEEGENFVRKLNGNFNILIFDIENQKLRIFNDIGGLRPFFYFHEKDNLIFGSEIKSLLKCKSVKREINDDSVADFFTFGKLLGDKTFFKGIRILPPATILTFKDEKLTTRKHWDFVFDGSKNEKDDKYYINKVHGLLGKSVRVRIEKHRKRTALALSGGLDTRLIASLIKDNELKTFTYGCGKIHDVIIAEAVSKVIKSDHFTLSLNQDSLADFIEDGVYLSEGMTNSANFSFLPLLEDVKNISDFVMTGSGLGEMFGDFLIDEKCKDFNTDDQISNYIYDKLKSILSEKHKKYAFTGEYYRKIKNLSKRSINSEIRKLSNKMNSFDKVHSFLIKNSLREIMYFITFTGLEIETLTPAWDKDFLDFMLEVPHKLRVGRYLEYKMLLESPELAKIQYNRTGVPVFMHARLKLTGNENALMKISKNGHTNIFSPDGIDHIDYAKALRESHRLVSFFEKVLFDKRTLGRGYFNQKFIKKMFYDHVAGKGDYHRILFAVITFEILLRTFFDKDAVKPSDNILKEH